MSWGERSCRHSGKCPIPDECSIGTCNVDCRKYEWDRMTPPDSCSVKEDGNTTKAGRNDQCPCNSGKKYKKCCGK